MVHHGGQIPGPKAIVNVHHRHTAGTGIEHTQQRRNAAKGCAIAHAGGHRNHWAVAQPSNDAGQGTLHTCNGNDHGGIHKDLTVAQKPVNAGDPHIIEPCHIVSQKFSSSGRFLGYMLVAGAAGGHHDGGDDNRRDNLSECVGEVQDAESLAGLVRVR